MTSIGTNRERHLTRGVFPIAPVKPFTDCDMKVLEVTDFNAAVLERIIAVERKRHPTVNYQKVDFRSTDILM